MQPQAGERKGYPQLGALAFGNSYYQRVKRAVKQGGVNNERVGVLALLFVEGHVSEKIIPDLPGALQPLEGGPIDIPGLRETVIEELAVKLNSTRRWPGLLRKTLKLNRCLLAAES